MEIMMMIGRYAGEIRDVHPFYARELVSRGEALDPNAPIVDVETPTAPVAVIKEVDDRATVEKRHRRRV